MTINQVREISCDCRADCPCGLPVDEGGLTAPYAITDYARTHDEMRIIASRQKWGFDIIRGPRSGMNEVDWCPSCNQSCRGKDGGPPIASATIII